jgi:hypothetical protein
MLATEKRKSIKQMDGTLEEAPYFEIEISLPIKGFLKVPFGRRISNFVIPEFSDESILGRQSFPGTFSGHNGSKAIEIHSDRTIDAKSEEGR